MISYNELLTSSSPTIIFSDQHPLQWFPQIIISYNDFFRSSSPTMISSDHHLQQWSPQIIMSYTDLLSSSSAASGNWGSQDSRPTYIIYDFQETIFSENIVTSLENIVCSSGKSLTFSKLENCTWLSHCLPFLVNILCTSNTSWLQVWVLTLLTVYTTVPLGTCAVVLVNMISTYSTV